MTKRSVNPTSKTRTSKPVRARVLRFIHWSSRGSLAAALAAGCCGPTLHAQVFTVTTEKIEGRFLEFTPTKVELPTQKASSITRERIERDLQSEQCFAMRPLPHASRGLTIVANGKLEPSGSDYMAELHEKGISSRPGDRIVVTAVRIKPDRLIFELNGGPDYKHNILRHVEVGAGGGMGPVVQQQEEPVGSRLTLVFPQGIPNVNGDQVKALIAPILGFGVKSPLEAYTATLPPLIKNAVLSHHVLVGMNSDMVLHAMGQPTQRVREKEASAPFEEWIYGTPPEKVEFVRMRNDRVIRVTDAETGATPIARVDNEVGDYWGTQPEIATGKVIKLGDQTQADRDQQNAAPAARPSLRRAGETLPSDKDTGILTPQAVQFPTQAGDSSSPAASSPTVGSSTAGSQTAGSKTPSAGQPQ